MLLVIICSVMIICSVYIMLKRQRYSLPPGPRGWPIIGTLKLLTHLDFFNHRDQYGDVSYIKMGGKDVILLNTVEVVKEAFVGRGKKGDFNARPDTFAKRHMSYKDVVMHSPTESYWKDLRRLLYSAIESTTVEGTSIETVVKEELMQLRLSISEHGTEAFDIYHLLSSSVSNIVHILLIGERYDYNHERHRHMLDHIDKANAFMNPSIDALLLALPILRRLPCGIGSRYRTFAALQENNLQYFLKYARSIPLEEFKHRGGFVFELLREKETNDWMTDEHIKGAIWDILIGSTITTTQSLYSLLCVFQHYPNVQIKIQEEIDEVIGTDNSPSLAHLKHMPYTNATIFELLRYSSLIPTSVPHSTLVDSKLRDFDVPRGCIILPNLFRIHHDSDYWNDPWEFDPLRFLDDSGQLVPVESPARSNSIPFGVGKRTCIGEMFGKRRLFLYITHLLQNFTFVAVDDAIGSCDPRTYVADLIIHPTPYQLRALERYVNDG